MKELAAAISRVTSAMLIAGILASCGESNDNASSGSSSKKASSASSVSAATSSVPIDYTSRTAAQRESYDKYGHYGNPDLGYETMQGEREAWLWPFSRDSIWNMPIGSDAKYAETGWKFVDGYGIDEEYIWTTGDDAEDLKIYKSDMHHRWPDSTGGLANGGSLFWPKGATISKDLLGNTCSAILQPDGRHIVQLQPTCRDTADADYVIGFPAKPIDIYDEGSYGSHWGSALSTLGGSIRLGELTGDGDINHALKIDPYGKTCLYFDWETMGYTWPATTADAAASRGGYGGTNPNVRMGSLLALDPSATVESLGIKSPVGRKLFKALQDYGCYIVDDSACDNFNWATDIAIISEVKKAYGIDLHGRVSTAADTVNRQYARDMRAIVNNLKVVTNNSKKSVGGGGVPRKPLAPDLPSLK